MEVIQKVTRIRAVSEDLRTEGKTPALAQAVGLVFTAVARR